MILSEATAKNHSTKEQCGFFLVTVGSENQPRLNTSGKTWVREWSRVTCKSSMSGEMASLWPVLPEELDTLGFAFLSRA